MSLPIVFLFIGALAVTSFARRKNLPAPLLVVAVASLVSIVPGVPSFDLDAEIIFTLILPPLLYSAALDSSYLDFRSSSKPIFHLGLLLVFFTVVVVAIVARFLIPGMGWPAAFLLGAIVAPPDAVSAAAIGRKMGLPKRVMTAISGESLINDAASLTMFKAALSVVGGLNFTLREEAVNLFVATFFGILIGLSVGVVVHALRMRLQDSLIESAIGLIVPFATYIMAEHYSTSGVLAVVSAGLYLGFMSPYSGYASRLQENYVWTSVNVLLEAFVFALIGLQFHSVISELISDDKSIWFNLYIAGAILLTVILVRPLFIFVTYYPRKNNNSGILQEKYLSFRDRAAISWAGMRGVVTLAAAVSIPVESPHVDRNNIFLIAFTVTVGTLLIQGMTLPGLIKLFRIGDPDQGKKDQVSEHNVLGILLEAAVDDMYSKRCVWEKVYGEDAVGRVIEKVIVELESQKEVLHSRSSGDVSGSFSQSSVDLGLYSKVKKSLWEVQRLILVEERNAGRIEEEVMRDVLREIDFQEAAASSSWMNRL